jgi:Spy/CpxP family protein refolding chaperone
VKRRLFTAFIFLMLTVPFVFAQRSHTPPTPAQQVANRVARLTALLTLTTAQQATATTIFTTEQSALSTVASSMRTARAALKTAVESNDTAGISAQASAIGGLTTTEVQAQSTANADFYALLTPTQQAQYNKLGGLAGYGRGGGGFGQRGGRN